MACASHLRMIHEGSERGPRTAATCKGVIWGHLDDNEELQLRHDHTLCRTSRSAPKSPLIEQRDVAVRMRRRSICGSIMGKQSAEG